MLKSISIVTILASDLEAVEAAYRHYLDYSAIARGQISESLARSWGAPRMAGRDFILLRPASGEPVYLRFVAAEPVANYAALRSFGWNAAELLVADTDALARRLENSPFRIIGAPRNLSSTDAIRAMQVIGPAGELLYLTRVRPGAAGFELESAQSEVDRVFIVVVGGSDLETLRKFYADKLRLPVSPPAPYRISVLSRAYGMDAEQLHQLSVARLSSRFLMELDQYPPEAIARPCRAGELSPGIATVGFEIDSLDALPLDFISSPAPISEWPYDGRRMAATIGAANELIELIEAPTKMLS
jgi:hypothetical protein